MLAVQEISNVYQQKSGHTEKKNTEQALTSIYIWRAESYICMLSCMV